MKCRSWRRTYRSPFRRQRFPSSGFAIPRTSPWSTWRVKRVSSSALYQTELSFIPFPDDQPIVYPDAQMWEEMSAMRKKWKDYASVDLKDQEGPTAKIRKAARRGNQLRVHRTSLGRSHHLP